MIGPLSVFSPVEEETMDMLAKENMLARSMGLTYGMYKAKIYEKERRLVDVPAQPEQTKKSRRKYTDEEAFALWQAGKNDCEIGAALGVSRQAIQKWRDAMELPAIGKNNINTQNYHLIKTKRGTFVINGEDV